MKRIAMLWLTVGLLATGSAYGDGCKDELDAMMDWHGKYNAAEDALRYRKAELWATDATNKSAHDNAWKKFSEAFNSVISSHPQYKSAEKKFYNCLSRLSQ